MKVQHAPVVLVTRPQPGADATAADLRKLGFEPIVLPFTETVPCATSLPASDFKEVKAIAVTSAAAIRHLGDDIRLAVAGQPVFAVGDATADAATKAGFKTVVSANGDADALSNLMQQKLPANTKIAYICGKTRSLKFEDSMHAAGFYVHVHQVYETNKVSQLTYKINKVVSDRELDAMVLYSSISASIFAEFWEKKKSSKPLENIAILCISQKAAAQLPSVFQNQTYICKEPTHEAMMYLAKNHFSSLWNES